MHTEPTVIVLGAGASRGFGLPLGSGLRQTIAEDLNIMFDDWGQNLESGSYQIVDALRLLARQQDGRNGDINPYRVAALQISNSMRLSSSIDEYIERHKDDSRKVHCAKLAISKAILEAERRSSIFVDPRQQNDPFERAAESWLAYMLRDVTRGLSKANLPEAFSNLTIINFNYDRCVEHFCHHWFQAVYDLTEGESAEICQALQIYHPYGSLGPLRYQQQSNYVPYGVDISATRLIEMSARIRTYSEALEETAHPSYVASALAQTRRMVFLGFGFHSQNVRLLGATEAERTTLRCYATTQAIPATRIDLIRSAISASMRVAEPAGLFFERVNGSCEDFWNEYSEVIVN